MKPSTTTLNVAESADVTVTLKVALPSESTVRVPPSEGELTVIEGEFEIFLGGKTFKTEVENVYFLPRLISHTFKNIGQTMGRLIFVVSPSDNFEKFFKELSALPSNQPPDMIKVNEIFARYKLPID